MEKIYCPYCGRDIEALGDTISHDGAECDDLFFVHDDVEHPDDYFLSPGIH